MPPDMFRIENYLRAGEAFHFARRDLATKPPDRPHRHNYFELFLVERGAIHHRINGVDEVLGAGDMVFVRPSDAHALHASATEGGRTLNVIFWPKTAAHLVARYPAELERRFFWLSDDLPLKLHLEGPQRERAVNTFLTLDTSIRSLARIEYFLLSIMIHTLDEGATINRRAPGWLVAACRAARKPEVFRQGAAGFVAAAGRGHEHVCRQARRYLGVTPTAFVNRIRVQHAAMLLSRSSLDLQAIAQDCGLENLSHLHRLFREHYGTTPGAYRRRRARDPVQTG